MSIPQFQLSVSGAVLTLLASATAAAHHSAAPHFDLSRSITVAGTVTAFRFVNPHSYIDFTERTADGRAVAWRCELPARTSLARLGWTEDLFTPGRQVTVSGAPARREAQVCYLDTLTTDTGRRYARDQRISRVAAAPAPARAAVDAWGRTNLAGQWVGRRGPPGLGARPQPTPAGRQAAGAYDQRFDDPAVHCSPANILFGWMHDENVNQVLQERDLITLRYGYMDLVRYIHLDGRHPATVQPSLAGHSVGRWEGSTLVVDTVGFEPGVLLPMQGLMHSNQLQVTERFSIDARTGALRREFEAHDPLFLAVPWTGTDEQYPTTEPWRRFDCVELSGRNNQRPDS